MRFDKYDQGLHLFTKKIHFDINKFNHLQQENLFISNNSDIKTVLIPRAVNESINSIWNYLKLLESLNINDEIIVFAKHYVSLTKLFRNKKLSETELIGLFFCAGYILGESTQIESSKYYYFKRKKKRLIKKEGKYPLIKLERIGKNGRKIYIYKLRTMYPYAKYLHNNLLNQFGFNEKGKINNDFRITNTGKILRKYYLDEIPQIINLLKGDISFIGCRPVGSIFLEYYPREVYTLRLKFKPGIISPAISDNASTVKEVIKSEYQYLSSLKNNPFKTKFRVFVKAFANVIARRINSQ